MTSPNVAVVTKHSLAFILMEHHPPAPLPLLPRCHQHGSTDREAQHVRLSPVVLSATSHTQPVIVMPSQQLLKEEANHTRARSSRHEGTREDKRLARQCKVAGCSSYIIDRGLCFRHGGGRKCSLDGCDRSAKARGLCWRHGGSIRCSVASCTRGAKSRGLCWAHGGGKRCPVFQCGRLVSNRHGDVCELHKKHNQPIQAVDGSTLYKQSA